MDSAAPAPLAPFETIAERIRAHAQARPAQRALVQGDETLDYGALDALMDRVAASLQRDGVQPGESIAICAQTSPRYAAIFLGALRAGVAVAPLASSVTPQSFASMLADAHPRLLFVDSSALDALGPAAPRCAARRPRRRRAGHRARRLADAGRPASAAGRRPARVAVQHHLFVRHDRHAEGHRAVARHALVARRARRGLRVQPADDHDPGDAALLEHDPGRVLPDARVRRHRRADAALRRRRLPAPRRSAARDPHDAGPGAVPAHHGAARFRPLRPAVVPLQVLHQRAVRRRAEGRRARALARRPDRVLRHDRRRRHLHPRGAREPRQAAHGRPSGRRPRHPADRRGRPRAAVGRDRRSRRPLARHDDRLPPPAARRPPRPSGSTRPASASSAPATSAASMPTAS